MALVTTTTSAISATDNIITVASATSVAAGRLFRIDEEWMQVVQSYVSGTAVPVFRGLGSAVVAHNATANAVHGTAADFDNPPTGVQNSITLPATRARRQISYSASGAITLPNSGEDMVAVLVGTSALAMTIDVPTKDMDTCKLTVVGQAKSQSTVTVNTVGGTGTTGIGNAGSGYDVLTAQNAGNLAIEFIACNGFWCLVGAPLTGTSTALSWAIA